MRIGLYQGLVHIAKPSRTTGEDESAWLFASDQNTEWQVRIRRSSFTKDAEPPRTDDKLWDCGSTGLDNTNEVRLSSHR
jgi:hypothetical protein